VHAVHAVGEAGSRTAGQGGGGDIAGRLVSAGMGYSEEICEILIKQIFPSDILIIIGCEV
jgi:hypothetical protein